MKLKQWLCGATALAMLGACSDKDVTPDSGGGENAKGSGYVSIAIGMPAGMGTRAANDEFGDGNESEYAVKNVAVVFFTGREESAKFLKAYNVSKDFTEQDPANDQITSSNKVTFPVDVTETNESLWALALVNYSQIFSVDAGHKLITVADNKAFTGTIKEFMALTTDKDLAFTTEANFFMTNTPYTTSPGSNANSVPKGLVHVLAPVDKEKIADTESQAKLNPAAEIFVERAVAKVEVVDNIENSLDKIEKIEWVIDNTEPYSFVARNLVYNETDATNAPEWMVYTQSADFLTSLQAAEIPVPKHPYRFVGNAQFDALNPFYRLYYGVDPNGKGIDNGNLKVLKDADITESTFKGISDADSIRPQYCHENTFDVQHQDYLNTTRAIIKVTFAGGNFFTRGIDRTTKYETKDAQMTLAHFVLDNADVVKTFTDYFSVPTTVTIEDMTCSFNGVSGTGTNEWLSIGYTISNGRLLVSSIQLHDGKGGDIAFPESMNVGNIINSINSQVTFNAYVGGVAYYAVRIKHFGDDLTPWLEPEGETSSTAQSYPNYDSNNYLGRYGVLRNNWYQLNLTNINKYGEPLVGDLVLDKTPDDKVDPEKAISCKINILSWAKRSQNVDF